MADKKLIEGFLDKKNVFAVLGVSRSPEKYGYKVYKDLKKAGYKAYPVNPNVDEVEGNKCYSCLNDLPEVPDVLNIVTQPEVTEKLINEAFELGIKKIWMQPGSESEKALIFCRDKGINVLSGVCVMVERRKAV